MAFILCFTMLLYSLLFIVYVCISVFVSLGKVSGLELLFILILNRAYIPLSIRLTAHSIKLD